MIPEDQKYNYTMMKYGVIMKLNDSIRNVQYG